MNCFSAENSPGIAYPKRVGIGVLLISNIECSMEGHTTGEPLLGAERNKVAKEVFVTLPTKMVLLK